MSFESNKYNRYSSYCNRYKPEAHSWERDIHVHTVEELLLITGSGFCTITNNGMTVRIQAPAIIWNRIGSFHAVTELDEGLLVQVAGFPPQIFSQTPPHLLRTEFMTDRSFLSLSLSETQTDRMLLLFRTLFTSPQFQRQLLFPCIFHQISLYLASGVVPIVNSRTDHYIFDVVKFLQETENENVTIPELAERFNVGTTKLKKDFKQITSQTIHNFHLQTRLHNAFRLLASSKLPLAQVAAHCGFTDESHLIRSFRKHFGSTPAEVRSNYKSKWNK